MITIGIHDLTFECIIGILDFERTDPQRVVVDITIGYAYDADGNFIDYAAVAEKVKARMISERFTLVEEALETLSADLKREFPTIKSLTLTISKPDILPDCRVCVTKKSVF